MDPYSRGFRDGAAQATEAMSARLHDAIEVVEEPRELPVFSQKKVADMLRLLARMTEKLAAQIQAVGDEGDTHDDNEGKEAG